MKKLAFILLFAVGIAEIAIGILIGRLRIYAHEAPLHIQLALTNEQTQIFNRYIRIFKDQWHVVA